MATVKIKYLGTTSSGYNHKYEIIGDNATKIKEAIEAAKADGVSMNANINNGFVSSTHLHLTPEMGNEAEVDLKGFKRDTDRYSVNWFDGIDKSKQKSFSEAQRYTSQFGTLAAMNNAAVAKGLDLDSLSKLVNIQTSMKKGALIDRQLSMLSLSDADNA